MHRYILFYKQIWINPKCSLKMTNNFPRHVMQAGSECLFKRAKLLKTKASKYFDTFLKRRYKSAEKHELLNLIFIPNI